MENTEVMNIEETTEVVEPVVTEVAETVETVEDNKIGTAGIIAAGVVVAGTIAGAIVLWKKVIKPGVKKLKAKIEDKQRARALHDEGTGVESNVTTVDFEEVEDSDED